MWYNQWHVENVVLQEIVYKIGRFLLLTGQSEQNGYTLLKIEVTILDRLAPTNELCDGKLCYTTNGNVRAKFLILTPKAFDIYSSELQQSGANPTAQNMKSRIVKTSSSRSLSHW